MHCREVQAEILERKGVHIPMNRVIMTSDEIDSAWWQEVAALGWVRIDHEEQRTKERFGRWYIFTRARSRGDIDICYFPGIL